MVLRRERVLNGVAMLGACGAFITAVLESIDRAFYYDEIVTLELFVLVPLRDTVAKYVNLNNHFFLSVLNNIYLSLAGVRDITALMDDPAVIRAAQLPIALLSLLGLYVICRRFFSVHVAVLASIFLATSIPFVNYAVQIRGYSLSILLMILLLGSVFSHEKHGSVLSLAGIVLSTGLLLYTIPSNILAILGIGVFYCSSLLLYKFAYASMTRVGKYSGAVAETGNRAKTLKRLYGIVAGIVYGAVLGGLLYVPVLGGIVGDPQLKSADMFYMHNLTTILPQFVRGMVSWRYCVVAAALYGLYRLHGRRSEYAAEMRASVLMVLSLVLPLVFVFVHGDHVYDRHLIVLLPFFCVLLAIGCSHIFDNIGTGMRGAVVAVLISGYCVATMHQGLFCVECRLYRDIVEGEMSVNMLYNYYLDHFEPQLAVDTLEKLTKEFPKENVPVVLHYCDKVAMPKYVRKAGFNIYDNERFLENIAQFQNWCVISSKPFKFEHYMRTNFPDYAVQRANEALRFHNLFVVTKMR